MTVGELIKMFETYPDEMEIVTEKHSDYALISECEIIKGVDMDGWVMESHQTMSQENKKKEKKYLYLSGD